MKKSFWQIDQIIKESIEHEEFDTSIFNNDDEIITSVVNALEPRDCVELCLYCAKDCFRLNSFDEDNEYLNSINAQECINLVEAWLNQTQTVTIDDLQAIINRNDLVYYDTAAAAENAIRSENSSESNYEHYLFSVRYYTKYAIYDATGIFGEVYFDGTRQQVEQRKLREYLSIAQSFKSRHRIEQHQEKEQRRIRNIDKPQTPDQWFALLKLLADELEEQGQGKLFIQYNNRWYINLPLARNWNGETPFDIEHSGNSIDDLILNITDAHTQFWQFMQNYIYRLLHRSV